MAAVVMDCGRRLLHEVYDAQLQIRRLEAVGVRNSGKVYIYFMMYPLSENYVIS